MRVVCCLLAISMFRGPAIAQTAAPPQADVLAPVAKDDPAMAAAVRKAQATLPAFLEAARHPKAGTGRYAVKIGLGQLGRREFFWLNPFVVDGDEVRGRLANEPEVIGGYAKGDLVVLPLARVTDWMYVDGGAMKGNYSACALLSHASPETRNAIERRLNLDCASE